MPSGRFTFDDYDTSGFPDHKLFIVKVPLADEDDIDGPYMIFMCTFEAISVHYLPEMFVNIVSRFIIADTDLRDNIGQLIRRSSEPKDNDDGITNNLSQSEKA